MFNWLKLLVLVSQKDKSEIQSDWSIHAGSPGVCLGVSELDFPPFDTLVLLIPRHIAPFGENRNLYCQLVIWVNGDAGKDSVFGLITFNTNPF